MGIRRDVRAALRAFGRDEDGSMIIFGMFLMLLMLMVGGMAVDLMRFETNRTRLQATLDRAVLAAADLDQTLPARGVVEDYFDKAGLFENLTSISVTTTVNSRTVGATAAMEVDTFFMDLLGVESLEAPGAGEASESINDIEIVLVLDVSGSMGEASGGTTKIALLRAAASEFVETMRQNDTQNRVSIAIVPFNAQVNLGPTLFNGLVADGYNVTQRHGAANSFCLDMPQSVFTTPTLSRTVALPQAGWFDGASGTTQNTSYVNLQGITAGNVYCRTETQNFVRLASQNVATMQAQVNALTAAGNTSITMGMEWGLFLLDPASRPFLATMPGAIAGRPYAWNRENTLKVIVVMTDGEHVSSLLLDDNFRTQSTAATTSIPTTTPIYRAADGRYSIRHDVGRPAGTPAGHMYWVPHLSAWQWRAWNGTAPGTIPNACNPSHASYNEANCTRVPAGATLLAWNELWAQARVQWVAWQLYARALGTNGTTRTSTFNLWMDRFLNATDVANMNATLQQTCAQARANGVIVFGIAFEAPANGRTQIQNCSSSPTTHYFNATGLEISEAFRTIASQITALRLTQ